MDMVRNAWVPAVWAAFRANALTRSGRDVLLTLLTFRGRNGDIYPSHASLARRVVCCPRTVRTALADAQDAGLVSWKSGRRRRTSNRYTLELPDQVGAVRVPRRVERLVARTVHALVGNRRSGGEHQNKKGSPSPTAWVVATPVSNEREVQITRQTLAAIAERRRAEREAVWSERQMAYTRRSWSSGGSLAIRLNATTQNG